MTETMAYGYSSESTQRELSNEYQHDRVKMVFKVFCIPVVWMIVASVLDGLIEAAVLSLLAENYHSCPD